MVGLLPRPLNGFSIQTRTLQVYAPWEKADLHGTQHTLEGDRSAVKAAVTPPRQSCILTLGLTSLLGVEHGHLGHLKTTHLGYLRSGLNDRRGGEILVSRCVEPCL